MKKRIVFFVLSFVIAVSMCPVSQAAGNDTTPPDLISISLNKIEFEIGETVVVTVKAKDDETGLDIAPCWVGIGKDTTQSYCYALHSTPDMPNTYTASWTISNTNAAGTYYVNAVYLQNNGMIGCQYSISSGTLSNEFQFNIINEARTDWTGPTLDELTVDRTTANVGDTITFSVKANDPSGVNSVSLGLYYDGVRKKEVYLKKGATEVFTGTLIVTSSFNNGIYTVGGVFLNDKLSNHSEYTAAEGSLPESMRCSINITNPNVTPLPEIIINSIEIVTPHIKQGDPLTVQMEVDPNGFTSFGPIDLGYKYPNQNFFIDTAIRLNRQSSSSIFKGTRIIPPNSPAANYSLSSCYIWQNIPFNYRSFLNQRKQFVVESVFSGTENCSVSVGNVFDPLAGVSACNDTEGDMTSKIEVTGTVDTSKVGVYLIKYSIPSEYKKNQNDTKQYYYYDFRWVGVTEVLPLDSVDAPIVLTEGDVVIDSGEDEVTLMKDGDEINNTDLATEEGQYSVELVDPDGTNPNSKQSIDFNIDQSAPEINLTQTTNPDGSVRVVADVCDISEVTSLKWSKGERDVSYFNQNGQAFNETFDAKSFDKYTIYAEDILNNADVKVIDIEQTQYTVAASANSTLYGSVTGDGTYSIGETVTFTATPNTGYRFVRWTKGGVEVSRNQSLTVTVTENAGYTAEFAPSTPLTVGQPAYVGSYAAKKIPSKANSGNALTIVPPAAPKGYTIVSITYSSTNPAVATVDTGGNVTFLAGGKAKIITKIVSQKVDSKGRVKTKTTTIKKSITVKQPVGSISLSQYNATIARRAKVKLSAVIAPATASSKKVRWTSSNKKVATVSSSGVVTGKGAGTAIITCTAKDGSNVSASCTVTVTPIYPTALKMSKAAKTVNVGKTTTLKAKITPKTTDFKTLVWQSSNPAVATVNAKGKVRGVAPGIAIITATTSNGIIAMCTVTVK